MRQSVKRCLGMMVLTSVSFYVPASYAIDQTKEVLQITTDAFRKSINFISDTTTSTRDKFKLVQAAKSDAAAYVGSEGHIKGPYLNKALYVIRDSFPEAKTMDDLALAKAILAVQ